MEIKAFDCRLGGLQVAITTSIIFVICWFALSLPWQTALAIGLMLALSSTAIVLQTLTEKGWIKQDAGQNSFSVLLFQDIAVIPILAILPLLAFEELTSTESTSHSLIGHLPIYGQVIVSLAVITAIILAGKYISSPLFRYIAETRLREIFTITALLLVIAIALIMEKIGVVLAESEFSHELEVDIETFKGLLVGLFFITVGASIDFPLLYEKIEIVTLGVIGLIVIKAMVLYFLAHIFKMKGNQKLLFTLALAQGGEFAFVLLSLTNNLLITSVEQTKLITLIVAISMLCAPLLLIMYEKSLARATSKAPEFDSISELEPTKNVIIAGYGRFGQVIGRLLTAQGYHLSILDHSPSQVDLLRRFGNKVFYGDAARQDLLEAAGAKEAKMLVIAVDERDKTLDIIELAHKYYPHLKIMVRAIDRRHAYQIMQLGVTSFKRETFDSAVNLGVEALILLGNKQEDAARAGKLFTEHDIESMTILADKWGDDKSYGVAVRQRTEDLKQVLQNDKIEQEKLNICQKQTKLGN